MRRRRRTKRGLRSRYGGGLNVARANDKVVMDDFSTFANGEDE